MRVEYYIAELLYRYNCVVVPEFGAFLANTISARIDDQTHTFYPPTKQISFNAQLTKNDGLLVSHIASIKKLPYEDLLGEVAETAKQWRERLENGRALFLDGIGKLNMDPEGKIRFTPEETTNFLASAFGLSTFSATPCTRGQLKEEVEEMEERIPFIITPEKRENHGLRPILKYAAVFLLLMATGASGYQFYSQKKQQELLVREAAQEQVSKYIQEATFFEGAPLELPELKLTVTKKEQGPKHHIIAGAFRIKENADKKISDLRKQGFESAYLGTNAYGLHQITYASFADGKEALQFLRKIKKTVSKDAWMLSKK